MNLRYEDLTEQQKIEFSMNGEVRILQWKDHLYDKRMDTFYDSSLIEEWIKKSKNKETNYYNQTDTFLYNALSKYSIKNEKVAIIGSYKPWYECVCLANEGIPYTIEYNKIQTNCDLLNLFTVEEYNKNPIKFNFAFSISSFEHDGLGRYGDPINFNGDILAMQNVKQNILNKDGILFLAVPVGIDKVIWNAHRIYGQKRLNLLFDGFELLDVYGFSEDDLKYDTGINVVKQPVFVLKNKGI
jgi:hypothetical protein